MIFGNRETFAIECTIMPERFFSHYTVGKLSLWIGNEQIGDPDDINPLEIPNTSLTYHAREYPERRTTSLEYQDKTAQEVLGDFRKKVYDDYETHDALSYAELKQITDHYTAIQLISPAGTGPPFDGWLVLLIDTPESQRLIWHSRWAYDLEDIKANEIVLRQGDYEKTVKEYMAWFDQNKKSPAQSV